MKCVTETAGSYLVQFYYKECNHGWSNRNKIKAEIKVFFKVNKGNQVRSIKFLFLHQYVTGGEKKTEIISPRSCAPVQCLAPLTLCWLSDIPCGECVRSGCSDCCAVSAGAETEGSVGPRLSDTCCDNMTQCFNTGTTDVGSIQKRE